MTKSLKEKALNLMQSICLTYDLDHLSAEEIEKTLWQIFEQKSKEMGLDISKEQLKGWIEEDKLKKYVILEDKNPDWHGDGSPLFSKEHIPNGLKINPADISITSLEEIIWPVKIRKDLHLKDEK